MALTTFSWGRLFCALLLMAFGPWAAACGYTGGVGLKGWLCLDDLISLAAIVSLAACLVAVMAELPRFFKLRSPN